MFSNLILRIGDNALEFTGQFGIDEIRDVVGAWLANLGGQGHGAAIAQLQADVQRLQEEDVTQKADVAALSQRLDNATNEIAKDLTNLRQKIADGTISAADLSPLDAAITRLEGLGADPSDPVPDPQQPSE